MHRQQCAFLAATRGQGVTAMTTRSVTAPPDGFAYVADFLTGEEQQDLLLRVRALSCEHDEVRGRRLKRAYAQFGYAYVSSDRRLDPAAPLPAFLVDLAEKGLPHCPTGTGFDQCIV